MSAVYVCVSILQPTNMFACMVRYTSDIRSVYIYTNTSEKGELSPCKLYCDWQEYTNRDSHKIYLLH